MFSQPNLGFAGRRQRFRVGLRWSGGAEPVPRRDRRGREPDARARACYPAGARRSRHSGRAARATNLKLFFSDVHDEALLVFHRRSE
jgi:hypothetical protein